MNGRSASHVGCAQSISARKRIEQVLGWMNQTTEPGVLKPDPDTKQHL